MLFDQRSDFGDFRLAADEGRNLRRQIVGEMFERSQRRKVGNEVWCEQLVDALRLREVFETVLPEIAQAALRGQIVNDQLGAGTREEHLSAVADRQ